MSDVVAEEVPAAPSAGPAGADGLRVVSLDGLRGAAALVVAIHHSLLVIPLLAAPYFGGTVPKGSFAWLLEYTPLHLLWNGTVAVYVFFVLSGVVLTLPVLRPAGVDWRAYYPRRLIRLYVPVWVSVGLAYTWAVIVPRASSASASAWLNIHHRPHEPNRLQQDLLLFPKPGFYNSVLWSLGFEVVFSLTLPLFVLFVLTLRRWWPVKLVLLLAASFWGVVQPDPFGPYIWYLPMFGVGALMAAHRADLQRIAGRLFDGPAGRFGLAGVAVVAAVLATARWDEPLVGINGGPPVLWQGTVVAEVLGAALLVFLAWYTRPWQRWSQRPVLRWLGSRSYSLYLVHEPIVVSLGLLLRPRLAWLTLLLAAPLVLAVTEVFHRFVERPSMDLARAVGRRASSLLPAGPVREQVAGADGAGR